MISYLKKSPKSWVKDPFTGPEKEFTESENFWNKFFDGATCQKKGGLAPNFFVGGPLETESYELRTVLGLNRAT